MLGAAAKRVSPEIYSYHDYRAFLRDWLDYLRSVEPKFSLRGLAKAAGFSSAYLPMVLSGRRAISEDNLNLLIPHLKLDPSQRSYLRLLCQFRDSESHEESLEALGKAQRFEIYRRTNPQESETYTYLTQWQNVLIREMVSIPDFRPDPKWIQEKMMFHVPIGEVARALEFLIDHEYITQDENGKWRIAQKRIDCIGEIYKIVLGQYHKKMLAIASRSIEEVSSEDRNIAGLTFSVSKENFQKMREILDRAMAELEQIADADNKPERTFHVTLAAFPLTKKTGAEDEQ